MQEKAERSSLLIKILFFTLFIALLIFQNTQHIADRILWLDEAITFKTATLPFWDIPYDAAITSWQMQPPLFYWLGHITAYIGDTPTILRSVSVACYILLLWFVIFRMHELQITSRLILCFVLIFTPFASYATTEFRPYALAAFSILLSSVFLYRLLQHPSSWTRTLLYGLSALILQYSLTLNCFG
jgi:4-amino-4-deoxy-L-arabinose transferase-like glycosyltransferase